MSNVSTAQQPLGDELFKAGLDVLHGGSLKPECHCDQGWQFTIADGAVTGLQHEGGDRVQKMKSIALRVISEVTVGDLPEFDSRRRLETMIPIHARSLTVRRFRREIIAK